MILAPSLRRRLTVSLPLAFIGALFVFKYTGRFSHMSWIAAFSYAAFFLIFTAFVLPAAREHLTAKAKRVVSVVLFAASAAIGLGIVCYVPEGSHVGRLTAVHDWLSAFLSGNFPYAGPSLPSAFPMLFITALPFQLIGNVGLLEVTGIVLFAYLAIFSSRRRHLAPWPSLAVLLLLPTTYFELLTRSELFFNMSLVLLALFVSQKLLASGRQKGQLVLAAAVLGLVLSTRTTVGLVYAIYFAYRFKDDTARGIAVAGLVVFVFFLTIIPFVLWDSALFMQSGPFAMQARYLPFWMMPLVLAIAIWLGLAATSLQEVLLRSGLLLFGVVLLSFVLHALQTGWSMVLEAHGFDISYFIFCIPFLILSADQTGAPGPARTSAHGIQEQAVHV